MTTPIILNPPPKKPAKDTAAKAVAPAKAKPKKPKKK